MSYSYHLKGRITQYDGFGHFNFYTVESYLGTGSKEINYAIENFIGETRNISAYNTHF